MLATEQFIPDQHYIDGTWGQASSGKTFDVVNPATLEVVATLPEDDAQDVDAAAHAARRSFNAGDWSTTSQERRCDILLEILKHCEEVSGDWAMLDAMSGGSTLRKTTLIDIPLALEHFRQMVQQSRSVSWYEPLAWTDMPHVSWNFVQRSPIGVCGLIVPWNFPLPIAMWKIAPALAMGNSVIVKPSPFAPLSILAFAKAVDETGLLPKGVFNVLTGGNAALGEALVVHPEVDKISFTGSTATGKKILHQAADGIKKVTLELGGKSANIVCDDADLDIAVDGTLFGVFLHQGQLCESGTRCFVHESIYDEFMERLVAKASSLIVGDPLDPVSNIGPLINEAAYTRIMTSLSTATAQGARIRCGGSRPDGIALPGAFLAPTIIDGVTQDNTICREELFGPVLVVEKWSSQSEVIRMANDSLYGLAGGVWSRNTVRAIEIARQLQTGTVWINDWHLINGLAPFGGFKQSGIGRELGPYGLLEYTEVKHIHVDQGIPREDRFIYDVLIG